MHATPAAVAQAPVYVSALKASKEAGLSLHMLKKFALLGRIATVASVGSPIRFNLDDARRVASEVNAPRPTV